MCEPSPDEVMNDLFSEDGEEEEVVSYPPQPGDIPF